MKRASILAALAGVLCTSVSAAVSRPAPSSSGADRGTAGFPSSSWVVSTQSGSSQWLSDPGDRGALRLTSDAVGQAGTFWGQQQSVVLGSRPDTDPVQGGRVQGSGSDCCDGDGQPEDTWYAWRMRFPAGYKATQGTQNYGFEFHVDDKTAADAERLGNQVGSTVVGVMSSYPVTCTGNPSFCTRPGRRPRLFLQVTGGRTSDPAWRTIKRYFPFAPDTLRLGHWYEMVMHVYWSADPSVGHVQWWVDGKKVVDVSTATEYVRSDGTYSYVEDVGMENYRLWASWASSIDFGRVRWGPTAASIGLTP